MKSEKEKFENKKQKKLLNNKNDAEWKLRREREREREREKERDYLINQDENES